MHRKPNYENNALFGLALYSYECGTTTAQLISGIVTESEFDYALFFYRIMAILESFINLRMTFEPPQQTLVRELNKFTQIVSWILKHACLPVSHSQAFPFQHLKRNKLKNYYFVRQLHSMLQTFRYLRSKQSSKPLQSMQPPTIPFPF